MKQEEFIKRKIGGETINLFPTNFSKKEIYEYMEDYLQEQLKLLNITPVSNRDIVAYIENEAEIAMPVNELMHEDGRHLTKHEYGKVLIKYLVIELRNLYC